MSTLITYYPHKSISMSNSIFPQYTIYCQCVNYSEPWPHRNVFPGYGSSMMFPFVPGFQLFVLLYVFFHWKDSVCSTGWSPAVFSCHLCRRTVSNCSFYDSWPSSLGLTIRWTGADLQRWSGSPGGVKQRVSTLKGTCFNDDITCLEPPLMKYATHKFRSF